MPRSALTRVSLDSSPTRLRLEAGDDLCIQRANQAREFNIVFRDAADGVRPQRQRDFAEADFDVGMMIVLFGEVGDLIDELHRGAKRGEFIRAVNGEIGRNPVGQFDEQAVEFFG